MVDFLLDILIKLLFGPWFYLADHIPLIQGLSVSPKQLFAFIVAAWPIVASVRIRALKKEKLWPLSDRIFARIFYSCLWLAFIGALANSCVMIANNSRMPDFVKDHNSAYLKNVARVIDERHVLADGESRLLWLSDYVDSESSEIADFFYPYSYSSPGDLALAAAFVMCWWLLIAILIFNTLRSAKGVAKKTSRSKN